MRRLIAAAWMIGCCGTAMGHGSSYVDTNSITNLSTIPISTRMYYLQEDRWTYTVNGQLLMCLHRYNVTRRNGMCEDADGNNAWRDIASFKTPDGYRACAYSVKHGHGGMYVFLCKE